MPRFALLTYQKAGSQWAKDVLFGAATLHAVPGARHVPSSLRDRLRAWSERPELTCSGPFYDVCENEWSAWSRPEDRAVHVYRDPRDRLISWVFSMSYSHFSNPQVRAIRGPLCSMALRDRIALGIAVTGQPYLWMVRSWQREGRPDNVYSVSFERLIADPSREFTAIFATFGWHVSPMLLASVLASQGYETRSGGRAPGETNEMSHYRSGVAGDWKTYFDRDLGRAFEASYPHALVELGYESSDDWFEGLPETIGLLANADPVAASDDAFLMDAERLRRRNAELEATFAAQANVLHAIRRLADESEEPA